MTSPHLTVPRRFRRKAEWESIAYDVRDIKLIHPRSAIVHMPYLDTGDVEEGLGQVYIPMSELLPKIFTQVLKTKDCRFIKPGDTVMFLPNCVMSYLTADYRRIWALDERACQLVIEGWK